MPEYLYVLYNWTLWNIAFFVAYKQVMKYKRRGIDGFDTVELNRKKYSRLYFIFILYFLFTFFGGDREAYEQMVDFAAHYSYLYVIDMESVYIWIAKLVDGSFILWKAIVYGGALLLSHFSMKRMNADSIITLLFFTGFCLFGFGAARAILAYSIYVFGLTFLKERGFLKPAVGGLIVMSSFFFHNSMLPLILMTPLYYFRLDRKRILIFLLAYPFVQIGFNLVVDNLSDYLVLFSGVDGQEHMADRFENYTGDEREAVGHSRLYYIQILLELLVFVPFLFYAIKQNIKRKIPEEFNGFVTIMFFLAYLVLMLKMCPLLDAFEFYWRYFSLFPYIAYILAIPVYNAEKNNLKFLQLLWLLMALAMNFQFLSLLYNEMTSE